MKKFLSTILAVVMVLSSMAMVVSANETAYITAVSAEGVTVGTYSTVDAAANAVGAGGTLTVTGDLYVDTVQTIAYDGITLEGAPTGGAIIASDNFKNSSVKNRKALLTISVANAEDGVTVQNISFDGSAYGDTLTTLDNTDETRFSVVRVNQGSAAFTNVSITGSPRTLLTIGTSTYNAIVTATNLELQGSAKSISSSLTYADVEVANGSSSINGGKLNAFVLSSESKPVTVTGCDGVYGFAYNSTYTMYTTPEHIAYTYLANVNERTPYSMTTYVSVLSDNESVSDNMINNIVNDENVELAEIFVDMMEDMLTRKVYFMGFIPQNLVSNSDDRAMLEDYIADLKTIIPVA